MKHLLLATVFLALTVTTAFANNHLSKSDNDVAMINGRALATAKIAVLQTGIANNNTQAIQTAVSDILNIMYNSISQITTQINYEPANQKKAANAHLNDVEKVIVVYRDLAVSAGANKNALLTQAKEFLKLY